VTGARRPTSDEFADLIGLAHATAHGNRARAQRGESQITVGDVSSMLADVTSATSAPILIDNGLLTADARTDPEDLADAARCWRALVAGNLLDVRVSDLPALAATERISTP
jgi:hypothetical protein